MASTTIRPKAAVQVQTFGEPQLHTDAEVVALAFAADGTLCSIEETGILRRWNPRSGEQLAWHSLSDMETLWAFSSDARVLASASDDLTFWDTSSGLVLTGVPQDSWVNAVSFHPDLVHIATGHDDGVVRYWDGAGHKLVHELRVHKLPISALAISPDGSMLAAAGEDKVISLWNLDSGKQVGTLKGHTDRIPALAWHPAGQFLISAGWDTTARVWDILTQQPVILLNSHGAQVNALAFSSDGQLLASADSALEVHVWDFAARKELQRLTGPQDEIRCLAFSADSQLLACNGANLIHLWDPRTGQAVAGSSQRVVARNHVAVSPAAPRLAWNGGGLTPRIADAASGQLLAQLDAEHPVHGLAWSPDGRLLAGAEGESLRLWDAATGKPVRDLDGPEEAITTVAFSPDGALLASGSSQGLGVWLWRVADGEPVLLIPDALDGCTIEALAFHPSKPYVIAGGIDWMATGGSNGAISIWDYAKRHEVATFSEGTQSLAVHPSGARLASASLDQSILIWDLGSMALLAELTTHDGTVTCIAYSPDGKLLASAAEDRTLRLWDDDGDERAVIELDSLVSSVAFSADGQSLFTGNANSTCSRFDVAELLRRGN